MTTPHVIHHAPGAPGLRLLGLGPGLIPTDGLKKLQFLLNMNAFWSKGRSIQQLKKMLCNSQEIITIWQETRIIGFGRATSDKIYRAVLWDVVVANDLQGLGIGRLIVEGLLKTPSIRCVEKIYLMTTNSSDFYEQMGFNISSMQSLMIMENII